MGNKIQEFIEEPDNIFYLFAILLALGIALLDLFDVVDIELVVAMVLLVLATVIALMLKMHRTLQHMQKQWQFPIEQLFKPFSEMHDDLVASMRVGDAIWLLSRTGQGWWRNYREIERILRRNGDNRFLVLDPGPSNNALKMAAKATERWWNPDEGLYVEKRANAFLTMLSKNEDINLSLKVIDYLPAWTLVIINPHNRRKSTIYVELATYQASSTIRPSFKVNPQDKETYNNLIEEFEKMWEDARALTVKQQY